LVGVLLVVPLLVEVILDVRARRQQHRRGVEAAHVAVLLPLITAIGYARYADQRGAQRSWDTHFAPVWSALRDGTVRVASDPVEVANVLAMLAVLVAVPLTLRLAQPASYIAYTVVSVIPVCFHETVDHPQSASRHLLVVFPVFVALAQLGRHRTVHRLIVTLSLAGLLALFVHTVRGSFVA
jgi:hypothetical protein